MKTTVSRASQRDDGCMGVHCEATQELSFRCLGHAGESLMKRELSIERLSTHNSHVHCCETSNTLCIMYRSPI